MSQRDSISSKSSSVSINSEHEQSSINPELQTGVSNNSQSVKTHSTSSEPKPITEAFPQIESFCSDLSSDGLVVFDSTLPVVQPSNGVRVKDKNKNNESPESPCLASVQTSCVSNPSTLEATLPVVGPTKETCRKKTSRKAAKLVKINVDLPEPIPMTLQPKGLNSTEKGPLSSQSVLDRQIKVEPEESQLSVHFQKRSRQRRSPDHFKGSVEIEKMPSAISSKEEQVRTRKNKSGGLNRYKVGLCGFFCLKYVKITRGMD